MNVDIVKTSDKEGAVFFKYKTSKISPTYQVTLPFSKNDCGLVEFKMTEETLRDLVTIIQQKVV